MRSLRTTQTRRFVIVWGMFTLGAMLGSGCKTGSGPANVPHLALSDVEGHPHYLTDYIGDDKVVVMSFWATWCMPCRQELMLLEKIYRQHRDRGLEILAISVDGPETQSSVRSYVRQMGVTFPILLDTETRAAALYNPRKQMPMMHIFDRRGRVVYSHSTFQPGEAAALRRRILAALDQPRSTERNENKEGEADE
jgi:peroxiredoxin